MESTWLSESSKPAKAGSPGHFLGRRREVQPYKCLLPNNSPIGLWYTADIQPIKWHSFGLNCPPKNQHMKLVLTVFSILICLGLVNTHCNTTARKKGWRKRNHDGSRKNHIFQIRKLRLKRMKIIVQYHTANQWWSYRNLWPSSQCLLYCIYSMLTVLYARWNR